MKCSDKTENTNFRYRDSLKELLRFVKPYKNLIMGLVISGVILAIFDSIYPVLIKYAIDKYAVVNADYSDFYIFGSCLAGVSFIVFISIKMLIKYAGRINNSMMRDIRDAMFTKLQELSVSFYDKNMTGAIVSNFTSDLRKVCQAVSWNLVDAVWATLVIVFLVISMLLVNVQLASIVISVLPVLIVVSIVLQKRIINDLRKTRKINAEISAAYNETVNAVKTIKTLVGEESNLKEFSKLSESYRFFSVRASKFSGLYIPTIIFAGGLCTALIILVSGESLKLGTMTAGTLVAFTSFVISFIEPIKQFSRVFVEYQHVAASIERIAGLLNAKSDIWDTDDVIEKYGSLHEQKRMFWDKINGDIEFKNVEFAYFEGRPILKNFNLKVRKGEKIALVGETGSGKSTIVNLICRFYEPTKGQILIDGADYRKKPFLWLYSNIGYVLQDPFLFDCSVKKNILYGRDDLKLEDAVRAAKIVNAHDFIMKLEKGYDTKVGEGGCNLSIGQRQLVSLARAIVRDPAIFILDEATSSIDTNTESLIQDAINKVLNNRTSFIVAHRLSTIREADRILVIERGRIIEEGNHNQLIKKKGYYYNLYTKQFMEEKTRKVIDGDLAI